MLRPIASSVRFITNGISHNDRDGSRVGDMKTMGPPQHICLELFPLPLIDRAHIKESLEQTLNACTPHLFDNNSFDKNFRAYPRTS